MRYPKSIFIVVSFILCLWPLTILADQNDFTIENITNILADLNQIEDNDQVLNLSNYSSFAAGCPDNTLFGQQYQAPTDTDWVASTSDDGATGSILVFDNFINTGSINKISFWGINGYYTDGRWYVCYESPMEFQIIFYDDNNGLPGTQIASYNVSCVGNQTGLIYGGAFELYLYLADLPEPIEISEGWISIQGIDGNPECWFEWMSSSDGYDNYSVQWDGNNLNIASIDRSFCLQHQEYLCGDIDGDNVVNLFDIIYFINYKYKGGPPPVSMLTADTNVDGYINILDVIAIVNFKFKGGPTLICP